MFKLSDFSEVTQRHMLESPLVMYFMLNGRSLAFSEDFNYAIRCDICTHRFDEHKDEDGSHECMKSELNREEEKCPCPGFRERDFFSDIMKYRQEILGE